MKKTIFGGKLISLIAFICFTSSILAGCQTKNAETGKALNTTEITETTKTEETNDKLQIVCTIFPLYDWTKEIVGDAADVTLLLNNGTDLHSYQASTSDIAAISSCDILLYVGGTSDRWVEDVLDTSSPEGITVLNLMDILGADAKTEDVIEGMEHDHDESPAHEEAEYDEHVWLSLKNAASFVSHITDALGALDPAHLDDYTANATAYTGRINELDQKYKDAVFKGTYDTLLFGDRFPFRYLIDDYQLHYYAAFSGCSSETEASFETIVFLANKTDELGLTHILTIDGSDGSIAKTITESTTAKDQEILTLNSMQSVSADDAAAGSTYLSIMEENLEVFKKALGE